MAFHCCYENNHHSHSDSEWMPIFKLIVIGIVLLLVLYKECLMVRDTYFPKYPQPIKVEKE